MSYSDDYADMKYSEYLNKWVPRDEKLSELTPEQYRCTLARCREAEAKVKEYQNALAGLRKVLP